MLYKEEFFCWISEKHSPWRVWQLKLVTYLAEQKTEYQLDKIKLKKIKWKNTQLFSYFSSYVILSQNSKFNNSKSNTLRMKGLRSRASPINVWLWKANTEKSYGCFILSLSLSDNLLMQISLSFNKKNIYTDIKTFFNPIWLYDVFNPALSTVAMIRGVQSGAIRYYQFWLHGLSKHK